MIGLFVQIYIFFFLVLEMNTPLTESGTPTANLKFYRRILPGLVCTRDMI